MTELKFGVVTIGYAPREDFAQAFSVLRDYGWNVHQYGALNEIEDPQVVEPDADTRVSYVSAGLNGREVRLDEAKLLPFLEKVCEQASSECHKVALACTGDFTGLLSEKSVITPVALLKEKLGDQEVGRLAVVVPEAQQFEESRIKWQSILSPAEISIFAHSPYSSTEASVELAARVGTKNPSLVVLDCMGYPGKLAETLEQHLSIPVVCPQRDIVQFVIEGL